MEALRKASGVSGYEVKVNLLSLSETMSPKNVEASKKLNAEGKCYMFEHALRHNERHLHKFRGPAI